jgi:23S rRNA (guanosine2251-2'-O)-methyltransferase
MSKATRLFGLHAVRAVLTHQAERVHGLWIQDTRHDRRLEELIALAQTHGIAPQPASRHELDRLAGGSRHQGVVVDVEMPPMRTDKALPDFLDRLEAPPFLLVLDGVQDPHNLGACLRSADAAGVDAVIMPRDRAVGLTPVVVKVACGAAETVPVFAVTNLARSLRLLKERGVWIYGGAGGAENSLYNADLRGPLALVLGSEGKGIRRLTREHCDGLLQIPMGGRVESLNVSVAVGIFLFEAKRQRMEGAKGKG